MWDNSLRGALAEHLVPLLPAGWKFIPNQRVPETLNQITVVLKYVSLERLQEAPKRHLSNRLILTIATPLGDTALAENELDDAVIELTSALDENNRITWTKADKVLVNDRYLGWDISLTMTSQPTKELT